MKALVLCGGLPQLELIKQLQARGIETYLADMNPKAPAVPFADKFFPASAMDPVAVKKIAVDEGINFILTVHADQALLIAAQVSEELGLPCYLDYETAKNVSSKELMKKIFFDGNVPTSKYIIRGSLKKEDIKGLEFPLIVKPVDAYSSRGVKRANNFEELIPAFEEAVRISRTDTAIVEEFVEGPEVSVDVYIENGKAHVLGLCDIDKLPEAGKYIICRGRYPAQISDKAKASIQDAAQKLADAFHLVDSPMMIQLKVKDDDTVSVIEFCARNGGGIKFTFIKKVSGFDSVKAVIDLTLGEKPHVEYTPYKKCVCNEFIYAMPGVLDHYEGFEEMKKAGVISEYYCYKPEGYEFKTVAGSGDRAGVVCIDADTWEEVAELHKKALDGIKVMSKNGKDLLRRFNVEF